MESSHSNVSGIVVVKSKPVFLLFLKYFYNYIKINHRYLKLPLNKVKRNIR